MLYTTDKKATASLTVALDDMFLTRALPTAAGSRMLEGYKSLLDADVLSRLEKAGFAFVGKTDVGEFALDLLGETSTHGILEKDGCLQSAAAEAILAGEASAVLCLDVNGAPRRAAALQGLVAIKPTYGTVSRFGTIPAACSGETVSILAKTAAECKTLLSAIAGHDDKDGTSLPEEMCARVCAPGKEVRRIAVLTAFTQNTDATTAERLANFRAVLSKAGIAVCDVEEEIFETARIAWNILMSAEVCNNVSRYDGVKYGYRAKEYSGIDSLYTNSRTEAFGEVLKTVILYGSDTLSDENYEKVYDKALRVRRVIAEAFAALFAEYDAVLLPACSKAAFTKADVEENQYLCFEENLYTAPASLTGLPSVVFGGVSLVGAPFSEGTLLSLAELFEKEGK